MTSMTTFPFSIVHMPFIDGNIPQSIFYSALVGEFLRITRSTVLLNDFINKAKVLCRRMSIQGANLNRMKYSIKKIILRHPSVRSIQHFFQRPYRANVWSSITDFSHKSYIDLDLFK